jgi:hypothetical protein
MKLLPGLLLLTVLPLSACAPSTIEAAWNVDPATNRPHVVTRDSWSIVVPAGWSSDLEPNPEGTNLLRELSMKTTEKVGRRPIEVKLASMHFAGDPLTYAHVSRQAVDAAVFNGGPIVNELINWHGSTADEAVIRLPNGFTTFWLALADERGEAYVLTCTGDVRDQLDAVSTACWNVLLSFNLR